MIDLVNSSHFHPGGNVFVALPTGHEVGDIVVVEAFKVAVPDPGGVDPVGVVGV